MNGDFDPYEAWLKIPPNRRPPSYYDLVGVPDDETDRRRIDDAALGRVQQVRARGLARQSEEVTRLLNELSQALDCLTDPPRREQYDRERLGEVVAGWLDSGRKPSDFYELLDTHRFAPRRGHLLTTIYSARRHLEARAADGGADHERRGAAELLSELERAEAALSGPSAFQQYHRSILADLHADCLHEHGDDAASWNVDRLRQWLQREKRVHPDRVQAIVFGMVDATAEAWDQLLAELFPMGGRADLPLARPAAVELWEESRESTSPQEPDRAKRGPPKLPPLFAEEEISDERHARPHAGELRAARFRLAAVVKRLARGPGRRVLALGLLACALVACVVFVVLTVVVPAFSSRHSPDRPSAAAAPAEEAARQLLDARFAAAMDLIHQTPPDHEAAAERLRAACRDFPKLNRLEREYAWLAWCSAQLGRWPETWRAYEQARRRLGPSGRTPAATSDDPRARLADVRQIVYLSTTPETRAVWADMGRLEEELGGTLQAPEELASLFELPDEPRMEKSPAVGLATDRETPEVTQGAAERAGSADSSSIRAAEAQEASANGRAPLVPSDTPMDKLSVPPDPSGAVPASPEPAPASPEVDSPPELPDALAGRPLPLPPAEPTAAEPEAEPDLPAPEAGADRHVLQVSAHQGPVRKVAWSPDGEHVTTAGDDMAKLWDPWTGETVRTLGGRTPVADLAWCPADFAPGAALLAVAGEDGKLRVFDLAVESGLPRQVEAGSPVDCLTWSPDGERLAAGLQSGELLVCGPPNKETDDQGRRRTSTSFLAVTAIAWHPEARHVLAVGDEDGLVWIWDLRRFVPVFGRVDVNADSFRGMVTANADLRDLIVNGSLRLVSRRATRCHALAWAPRGDRLVAVEDAIEVWDFDRTRGLRSSISLPAEHDPGPASGFTCVAWHPGGRSLAAGASDGRVVVFDLLSGRSIQEYGAPAGVGSVAWNRRGRHLAAGSNDGTLTVWEFDRQRER